jgi:hypothetical protein
MNLWLELDNSLSRLVSGYRAAGSIPARGAIVARTKQISDLPTVFDKNTF